MSREWKVVRLSGDLETNGAESLRRQLRAPLAAGHARLLADLSTVRSIDSQALAVLVATQEAARRLDGDLILARPSTAVRMVLEMTRMDAIFEIVDSVDGIRLSA